MLRAAVASRRGEDPTGLLHDAARGFAAAEMRVHQLLAEARAMAAGDADATRGDTPWSRLRDLGVRRPQAFARAYAPGFPAAPGGASGDGEQPLAG
jgi:hypothetical protein